MRTVKSQIAWCARAHWVLSILMAVLIAAFVVFGWRPAWARQRQLAGQTQAAARTLADNQARTNSLPLLQHEVLRLKTAVDKFNKKLPRTNEIGEFFREVTLYTEQCSLRKMVKTPNPPRRLDLYAEVPIGLDFEGNFNDVFLFLRQIEQMPRLARIKNLTVKTRDAKHGTVGVNLALNIYYSEL